MVKKLALLGIAFIMLFSLAACNPPKEDEDMGLKAGFELDGDKPAPPIRCAFTSEKSKLKVGEDFTIKLSYGTNGGHYDTDPPPTSVSAKIKMARSVYGDLSPSGSYANSNELIDEFVLKEIDNFATPEYVWQYSSETGWASATETVVISANWFAGERGAIVWLAFAHVVWPEGFPETEDNGSVALYYRIEGENIILFDSYYKFFNDIRK